MVRLHDLVGIPRTGGSVLANGVAYRLYGRPGQFITFCADGVGRRWGNDVTLVSTASDTCANSSDVVLGPDRFMIAYTDYSHRDAGGRVRKAVLVREIVVRPGEVSPTPPTPHICRRTAPPKPGAQDHD